MRFTSNGKEIKIFDGEQLVATVKGKNHIILHENMELQRWGLVFFIEMLDSFQGCVKEIEKQPYQLDLF